MKEKILICGSRDWTDNRAIFEVIDSLSSGSIVIAGAARGADRIAEKLAEEKGDLTVESYPANWNKFGKRAGYLRNIEMLDQNPDRVYAFPLGESKGTNHIIKESIKRGIHTIIYGENQMPHINGYSIHAYFDKDKNKMEFKMYREADDSIIYSSGKPVYLDKGFECIEKELEIEARNL